MSNVIDLPVITRLNLDPDRTLEKLKGELEGFVIAGYDKEGNEVFSSTYADSKEMLWLLERLKLALVNNNEFI